MRGRQGDMRKTQQLLFLFVLAKRGSSVNIQSIIRSLLLVPIEQLAPAPTICNPWDKARKTRQCVVSKCVYMSASK